MGISWLESRIAVIVGALALLAATPVTLAAAGIKDPRALGGATGLAAIAVAVGAVWQDRYKRQAQQRDERLSKIELLLDGRLPKVRDISNPVQLGVHPARAAEAHSGRPTVEEDVPDYVPRDIDDDLHRRLEAGGFVLLVGDSTAGKSRAGFEAMRDTLANHLLIKPGNREAAIAAVKIADRCQRCVLWLDELERYLGTGGLTADQLGSLLAGAGRRHRVIIATIRAAELARITADSSSEDDAARQALRDTRQVIDQAHKILVLRPFSPAELHRANAHSRDPRMAEALRHADTYGVAEYLAAAPQMLEEWRNARNSVEGPHARGAALDSAAVDIRRAGYISAIPREVLEAVHQHYLDARTRREPLAEAWAWATRPAHASTALLEARTEKDPVEVFDYLVDSTQRHAEPSRHVPEPVVRAAIDAAAPADADSLAATAFTQGRYALAERGWHRAWQAQDRDPSLGHRDRRTLRSRGNLAMILGELGRLKQAEDEHRAVLDISTSVLGARDPDTLTARANFADWTGEAGDPREARDLFAALLPDVERVLGDRHPETLRTRASLARWTGEAGEPGRARCLFAALLPDVEHELGPKNMESLRVRASVAGWTGQAGEPGRARDLFEALLPDVEHEVRREHPESLRVRASVAGWTGEAGEPSRARILFAALLPDVERVLGREHPESLRVRASVAGWTGEAGDPGQARDLFAALLPDVERVLGREHPEALKDRASLARWTGEAGDRGGARDLFADLLPISERVLGDRHPESLRVRANAAGWTGEAGDPGRARDLFAALLPISKRVLGDSHPETLRTRGSLARWTGEAGDPGGARGLFAALQADVERVLGRDHPDTLTDRASIARWTGQAGDPGRARDLFAALQPDVERVLGDEHPETLGVRAGVAGWTGRAGDPGDARDLFAALQADVERVLGRDHPETLRTRASIARWTGEAGDPARARDLFAALQQDADRVLGRDHPDAKAVQNSVARWNRRARI